ncbi:CAP domain-containing protein [Streptomyces kunmingensis]|uniref:CAP domain-containing protein n=1 Tax=Streptomyces kunmingensis TaxID=68225 RepID=A0ABU6C2Q2_9ACTN|nr:CAP domain-containing protein [Streptomyces kunmingensis]MEB3958887.1 CAP domain-containing protein [Streptomyces kunmingensis]
MTSPLRSTFLAACTLLTALLPGTQTAWAGPPPVPGAPTHQVPRWTAAADGRRHADTDRAGGMAADVVADVNERRAEAGCRPVRLRSSLNRAARAHSADMARSGRLEHTGSDGSDPLQRMRAAGYRPAYAGEAIADGADTASAVVTLWMDSPSHRDLILTCRFTHAGVGMADGSGGPWWTLDLAAKR